MLGRAVVAALCVASAPVGLAYGAGAQELLRLVEKHKGRFPSEVKDRAAFEQAYTVRTRVQPLLPDQTFRFDDQTQTIEFRLEKRDAQPYDLRVVERCVKTGEGVGTNAFGVKVAFTRETCQFVALRAKATFGDYNWDGRGEPHWALSAQADAATYRKVRAAGFEVEITFVPQIESGEVVTYEKSVSAARLDRRVERTVHAYELPATIKGIRYFLPGAKEPFRVDKVD